MASVTGQLDGLAKAGCAMMFAISSTTEQHQRERVGPWRAGTDVTRAPPDRRRRTTRAARDSRSRSRTAPTVPSRKTSTRSISSTCSSTSVDSITTATPVGGELVEQRVDVALGAQVDAPGRVVEQQDPRLAASQRAMMTFCWLPPDSVVIGSVGLPIRMPRLLDVARRTGRGARAGDSRPPRGRRARSPRRSSPGPTAAGTATRPAGPAARSRCRAPAPAGAT